MTDLEPENVTVVDQRGKVLNRKTPDSVEGGTTFEYQQTLERTLESKATEVLERIVGAGRAVVRVRATLDFIVKSEPKSCTIPMAKWCVVGIS